MADYEILSLGVWVFVGAFTVLARTTDTEGEDIAGAMAAGVLWPVYLPYRLFLIVKDRRP